MTPIRIKPGVRALALTTTAFIALAGFAQQAQAATAANTVIRNQATATYTDAGGNSYQAQSNVAEITVQQVYSATISQDRTRPGAAGQTVYSSHTLTNLGNGDSYYAITVANVASGVTGPGFNDIQVFRDLNGNGVADAGEPVIATTTGSNGPIRLSASEAANLLIAARLPNGAVSGATFGAVVTATPVDSGGATGAFGRVTDTTTTPIAISDNDATIPGTNHLLTTVTSNAVLEVTKSATSTLVGGVHGVKYVVTVRNTGGRAAQNVRIVDALPDGTVFVPGSVVSTGFGPTINVGDVAAANSTTLDETSYGFDINRNGVDTDAGVEGVAGIDAELPAGATIQMTFEVTYDPAGPSAPFAAGDKITNIAYAVGDLDGTPGDEDPSPSNPAVVEAPPLRNVSLQDTGVLKGGLGVNDGGDDDVATGGGANDVQTVDTAPLGATVLFDLVVQNNGNIADLYNLEVVTGHNFPAGTLFSFWNATGTAQLLDTDGDGRPNTQTLAPGATSTVQVRAILPQQVASLGAGPYQAGILARSSVEPAIGDPSTISLLAISSAGVDLANAAGPWVSGTNLHVYDPAATLAPTTTQAINVGASASFPLFIHNNGGVADSFQLYAGGGWYAGAASVTTRLQALPAGWSVQFLTAANQPITTTPAIQPGGTYELRAVVQAPNNYAQALTDYSGFFASTGATDATEDRLTGGAYDGAYPIFFAIHSQNTGVSDVKLDAVKVNAQPRYELSADKDQQTIWPGGSSRTDHILKNTGNTDEEYSFSTTTDNPGWGTTILVDTNGDGQPDTPLSSLVPGNPVTIRNPDGSLTTVNVVTDPLVPGGVSIPLSPGQEVQVWLDVQAPTNVSADERNVVTLLATDGATTQDAQVPYRVSLGVLRLTKSATVDNGWCIASPSAAAPDATLAPASSFLEQGRLVRPGDCAIWQIVANNYGTESAYEIKISDAVPDFTVYRDGTLSFCLGDAGQSATASCSFAYIPASAVNGGAGMTPGREDISIDLDGLGLPVDAVGAHIASGASVTIRFATQVE